MVCLRVGTLIDYEIKFSEFGTDEKGAFAVVEKREQTLDVFIVAEITTEGVRVVPYDSVEAIEIAVDMHLERSHTPFISAAEKRTAQKESRQLEKDERQAKGKRNAKPIGPVAVTETLDVRLTEDERIAAAKNAASMSGLSADKKSRLKAHNTEWKTEIKALDEKIARAQSAHNTGLEIRSVTCMQHFDPASLSTWFVYNGEEYGRRAMNEREERETGANSLFGDAPMLPNKVNPSRSVISGGDELAKIAAEHNDRMAAEKRMRDTMAFTDDVGLTPKGKLS